MIAVAVLTLSLAQMGQPTLKLGSPAPALKVEQWVQGKPFRLDGNKTYIVEFWATWCGPCIQIMPHMSDLAEKFRGKVEVVGVNVSDRRDPREQSPNSPAHATRIKSWLTKNKKTLRYNVALDDAKDTMNRTWLVAAGQGGIPYSFVVKNKKIAWMGHPGLLNPDLLTRISSGTYNVQAEQKRQAALEASQKLIPPMAVAAQAGDLAKTEKAFLAYAKVDPGQGREAIAPVTFFLADANGAAAVSFLRNRAKGTLKNDPVMVIKIAYSVLPRIEGKKATCNAFLALAGENALRLPANKSALGYSHYAMMLWNLGVKDSARVWLDRATGKLAVAEPASERPAILKFIGQARAAMK